MTKITSNFPTPVPLVATTSRRGAAASADSVQAGADVGSVQSPLLSSGASPTRATAASQAPVDNARVEKLRAAVLDGSYKVDAKAIASQLVGLEKKLP